MVNFIIRYTPRPSDDKDYQKLRLRTQPGEIVDFIPDDIHPGLKIIDDPQYRIVNVPVREDIARMWTASDVLEAHEVDGPFLPRRRLYTVKTSDFLKVRLPYAVRGTYHDYAMSYADFAALVKKKGPEKRDAFGRPTE